MNRVSIYLYTDDGATVNCEIKSPDLGSLANLEYWLACNGCTTAAGVINNLFTGAEPTEPTE